MKRAVLVCCIVCAGLVALAALVVGASTLQTPAMEREGKVFVDEAVPRIVRQWDSAELLKRASPELQKLMTPAAADQLFGAMRRLGPLQHYEGATSRLGRVSYNVPHGRIDTATYEANAVFQNDKAQILVAVRRAEGRWMIDNFHVNSDLFLRPPR